MDTRNTMPGAERKDFTTEITEKDVGRGEEAEKINHNGHNEHYARRREEGLHHRDQREGCGRGEEAEKILTTMDTMNTMPDAER
jgi:hypothetical protein